MDMLCRPRGLPTLSITLKHWVDSEGWSDAVMDASSCFALRIQVFVHTAPAVSLQR
jgi:hypothetical protein